MRSKAIIHHLGLNHHDLTLVSSLVSITPLGASFELQSDQTQSPDVVLVNADREQTMGEWREMREKNSHIIPIMVTSSADSISDFITLRRPIVLKRLSGALEEVAAKQSFTREFISDAMQDVREFKRVLIVDDSFPVRKFMELELLKLTEEKIVIDFASCGEEAKQKFEENANPYDLVFLDVVMPDLDGYQVCKWIKSKYQSYIVMLTGKKSPIDKIKAVMSGSNNFLTKPPNRKRLQAIVEKCFASVNRNTSDVDIDFHLNTEV